MFNNFDKMNDLKKDNKLHLTNKKGQNNENTHRYNCSLIVQYLQKHALVSRAELSKNLGLTPASISKTTAGLLQHQVIEETGYAVGEKGRRTIGLSLNTTLYRVIGVKLSRRNWAIGVFDFKGQSYAINTQTFSSTKPLSEVFDDIDKQISAYLGQFDGQIVSIGMAVPGPYCEDSGDILFVTGMEHWKNINIKEQFENKYPVPMIIRHDANSGALAEWWFGLNVSQFSGTLVHFLVGEGVGAGILIDGDILQGSLGTAGEIGHISIDINGKPCACGNVGCLERYCSSLAFVEDTQQQLAHHPESRLTNMATLTLSSIFQSANCGDAFAINQVKMAGRYIGYGVVNLINAYNPDTIIISNDMAGGGTVLLDEIRAVVTERVPRDIQKHVHIELSVFSEDPILYGAAAIAIDYCLSNTHLLHRMAILD